MTKQPKTTAAPLDKYFDVAPSDIHALIGLTPAQVLQDALDAGLDPDAEVEAMRRLGCVLAAQYASQIEREMLFMPATCKSFPIFEDAVAAGAPAWSGSSYDGREASILDVLRDGDAEAVIWARVSGWSMRDEGIFDGDMVLVDTKAEAKDGDIVLAHIAGQGQVVKRLKRDACGACLESANPDFAPIVLDESIALTIHGVVIGRAGKL
ncbi:MAG: S24 family peptidase [Pseudomonadota bacterium]